MQIHVARPVRTLTLAAAAAAVSALVAGQAQAQKTINLTAIDGYPPKALWVKTFIQYFMPAIDERLAKTGNYKIKWNQAWSGQISKVRHVIDGLEKGLGDVGVVTSVFHSSKVPLQGIAYATPFVTTDPTLVSRTVDELANKYPAYKQAWDKYNQVYLTNLDVIDSYQMFFRHPVSGIKDFNGKKIATAGLNMRYLQKTGAVGVAGSLVHYYNHFKTGVVDGTMLWPEAIVSFKIAEVAPYMLKADIGSAASKSITFNKDSWRRLPAEVQKAIQEAAIVYRDKSAEVTLEIAAASLAQYKKMGGKITVMSQADRKAWAMSMPNVAKGWVASLEKKGIPAREILVAYMDKMRAAKQPIIRQWDKE